MVVSCSINQHVKTPLCEINDPRQKVVTQKTDGENRQTAAAVNQTKDNGQRACNHHLPAVNELSHLFGLAQALQGFSASSAPRLRDRVKDRSKSSCPLATQVQIATMLPGLESCMDQMKWNDTEKFHPSF